MGFLNLKFGILAAMLLGLPALGIVLRGMPFEPYLAFPPETQYVIHAPFSWTVFSLFAIFIVVSITPFLQRGLRAWWNTRPHSGRPRRFPWWGWVGVLAVLAFWVLAWTRFPWFKKLQPHTFTPLWLSYIVVVNALSFRRRGQCMMLDRPALFFSLFPLSATFWWFFEYLNRFVQNWQYAGVRFGAWDYFLYATLSFSTVLPAVLGTREWIGGMQWVQTGFKDFVPIRFGRPRLMALGVLLLAGAGLAGIGVWPDVLFPLLWISPLLILTSLQVLLKEQHVLSGVKSGDWRTIVSSAAAALSCGFFWEMWNYGSLAKWEYSVPFVQKFLIFEMPVLGYGGYLPFGLECAAAGMLVEKALRKGV